MVTVLIRTLVIYIFLVVALRLAGKRQVGELQVSELIITFMISELATSPIQDLSIPIIYSIIPIAFLLCGEIIFSFFATKSKLMKKALFGNPSIIIEKGRINQGELARLRIGVNELLGELRLKDVGDISTVEYAILEQNGKLSVFSKENAQDTVTHAIIVDGAVDKTNLKAANKSVSWLSTQLKKRSTNIKDVFLMTVNDNGKITIINKEGK